MMLLLFSLHLVVVNEVLHQVDSNPVLRVKSYNDKQQNEYIYKAIGRT